MIGTLLDIGNIIFFAASLGQLKNAIVNRRNLRAMSTRMLIGYIIASIFFIIAGYLSGGYITAILGSCNIFTWILQLYWKVKYR